MPWRGVFASLPLSISVDQHSRRVRQIGHLLRRDGGTIALEWPGDGVGQESNGKCQIRDADAAAGIGVTSEEQPLVHQIRSTSSWHGQQVDDCGADR